MLHHARAACAVQQEAEESLVPDTAVLDDLRHTVGENFIAQGVQTVRVHQHQSGLPEGSGQILSGGQVDGHFSTHGGVHLSKKGGGDLDIVHAAQDGGGGKTRKVAHHAATQSHHGIRAAQAEGQHFLVEEGQHIHTF